MFVMYPWIWLSFQPNSLMSILQIQFACHIGSCRISLQQHSQMSIPCTLCSNQQTQDQCFSNSSSWATSCPTLSYFSSSCTLYLWKPSLLCHKGLIAIFEALWDHPPPSYNKVVCTHFQTRKIIVEISISSTTILVPQIKTPTKIQFCNGKEPNTIFETK